MNSQAGNTVVLPDEAMERGSIYRDHGSRGLGETRFDLCIAPQSLVAFWVVATRPAPTMAGKSILLPLPDGIDRAPIQLRKRAGVFLCRLSSGVEYQWNGKPG